MPPWERFRHDEAADFLEDLIEDARVLPADRDGTFPVLLSDGTRGRLRMPTVLAPVPPGIDPRQWLDEFPSFLGLHVVALLEAGAAALGVFDDGEPIHHKTVRKYVVRGTGKYQRTHLETKGKSRYGSRLRLRNAVRFFEEVGERLNRWDEELGPFDRVFAAGTRRVWTDLFECRVPPPFGPGDPAWCRIGLDVRAVTHEEMLRVYRELGTGRLERSDEEGPPGG